jgi:CHAD domain-containing protein
MEDIHQLRVTIKKLRGVWSLLDEISKKKNGNNKHIINLNAVFKNSGNVREAQVLQEMIKKNPSKYLKPYKNYLGNIQKRKEAQLKLALKGFKASQLDKLKDSVIKKIAEPKDVTIFTKSSVLTMKKLKKVRVHMQRVEDKRELHKIRMELKVVAELLSIMIEIHPTTRLKKMYSKIKTLNQRIGKWHDYYELLLSLIKFKKTGLKKNKRYYENLMLRIEQQLNIRENKIMDHLTHLFNSKFEKQMALFKKAPIQ